tara:strand:+ start:198 stop:602 length:405 start_codon:yes stop_codon:yes gene_type:complete
MDNVRGLALLPLLSLHRSHDALSLPPFHSPSLPLSFRDIRRGVSTKTVTAFRSKMTTLAIHDYAPLIAAGSEDQCLRLFGDDNELLKDIRYHDGFMGRRIGSIASVAFHPHALFVAAGATDSIVSVRVSHHRRT